jgi:hypothetical protein
MHRRGGWLLAIVIAVAPGCRQLFGIDDTSVGGPADGPGAADAATIADAAPDGTPDAVPFTPDMCPNSYDEVIASVPGSRYRRNNNDRPFATHHADCNDDAPGWTHLFVPDTLAESIEAAMWNTGRIKYVGIVQMPGQAAVDTGWYRFTGEPNVIVWDVQTNEPNDLDGVENGELQLTAIYGQGDLFDVGGVTPYSAICECDGRAIDPVVAAYIP